MRKSLIYAFTAAAAMAAAGAATVPMTAWAAVNTYTLPGGNWNSIDCGNGFPGIQLPGNMFPGSQTDGNRPNGNQPDSSQLGVSQDDAVAQVVGLVNEERAKAGLSPLTVDGTVTNAAQKRAQEIETSFSHTRPNGGGFSTVLTEAGVNYRSAGENIAYGQESAARVMQDWMNSAGHRANILNGNFTTIGVGHYKNASGIDYWTQMFTN